MDAAEIEAFLVLAEELHFGRTAERLRVSQSRVSRLIAALERRAGGQLFERTSRRVVLTPAGVRLRDRVGPAWSEIEEAFADLRNATRKVNWTLRIGWPSTVSGPAVSLLTDTFRSSFPDCELVIHDVPVPDLYGPLRRGEIDVLLYWLTGGEPDLTAGPVIEYRDRMLAVGCGHRLAGWESVSVEDLADEEVYDAGTVPVTVWDALCPRRTPSGRPIPRAHPAQGMEDTVTRVARLQMVHPTMTGVSAFLRDDIRLVPIRDLPPMPLGLIWRTTHETTRVRALADVARKIGPVTGSVLRNPAGALGATRSRYSTRP